MQKIVAVNAVSLYSGGGLIVLKQFLAHVKDNSIYYVFVHNKVHLEMQLADNIKIIKIELKNFFYKLLWSSWYLNKWLNSHQVSADIIISLQNTSIRYNKNAKQIIYLHNALALHSHKWSLFKPDEQKLVAYKWLTSLLMFLHWHDNSKIVVQTEWMRTRLLNKYQRLNNKVIVIKPNIKDFNIDLAKIANIHLNHEISLFYPCSSQPFKNHIEIINALIYLKVNGHDISSIGYYLTIDKSACPELTRLALQHDLLANIVFLGSLPYMRVLGYYKACSIVVFPSKIESCGLPLLEGMLFNKPLIALADSYAKDTVAGYTKVIFAGLGKQAQWAQAILDSIDNISKDSAIQIAAPVGSEEPSWSEFFAVIHQ